MSTLFNAIIEEMEVTQAKETWDAYWMEAIKEAEDMENSEISFESIVDGDNAVKKGLSGVMRWLSSLGSNNKKLAWDMSVFEKIDKSKISKDVTGVATPEYVKTFTDCIKNMKFLSAADVDKLKSIAEDLKKDPKAPRNILRIVALVLSIFGGLETAGYVLGARGYMAAFMAFGFSTAGAAGMVVANILASCIGTLLWYFISKNNIDGASTSKSQVNTLLDLLAKIQNNIIGIDGAEINDSTFSKVESLTASLKAPGSTTITVEDQNKVADMLLEAAKVKEQIKDKPININKQGALGSIYSIGSEFKRGFKGVDQGVIDKCNEIIKLTTKVNTYMDALAGASKTIAADIRKW